LRSASHTGEHLMKRLTTLAMLATILAALALPAMPASAK
jgi:hypothetical protein